MYTPDPSVIQARQALKELEATLLAHIRDYENQYGVSVQKADLTHSLLMGHPRRVMSVLLTAIL
jgi:hypothetical protein